MSGSRDLVLSLDAGRGGTNYIRLMRRLTTIDLLILDDWGLQNFSAQGRRDILELIEPRSARRSTMIVSQLPVTAWHNVLGENTIADAILGPDRPLRPPHHPDRRVTAQAAQAAADRRSSADTLIRQGLRHTLRLRPETATGPTAHSYVTKQT